MSGSHPELPPTPDASPTLPRHSTLAPPPIPRPRSPPPYRSYDHLFSTNAIFLTYHTDDSPHTIWVMHPFSKGGTVYTSDLSAAASTTFPAVWTTRPRDPHGAHSFPMVLRIGSGPLPFGYDDDNDDLPAHVRADAQRWVKRCENVLMSVRIPAGGMGSRGGCTWCVEAVRLLILAGLADIGHETPEEIVMRAVG